MKGTLVNTATVIIGSLIGLAVGSRFTEKIKTIVMQALGLCTLLIGIRMALNTENILLVISSLSYMVGYIWYNYPCLSGHT